MKRLLTILVLCLMLALAVPAMADTTSAYQGSSTHTSWGGTYAGTIQEGTTTSYSFFGSTGSAHLGGSYAVISPDFGLFDNTANAFAVTGSVGVGSGFLVTHEMDGEAYHGTQAQTLLGSEASTIGTATYSVDRINLFGGSAGAIATTGGHSHVGMNNAHSVSFSAAGTF